MTTPTWKRPDGQPTLSLETIESVVRAFYARARTHPDLAEAFAQVDDWDEHIARITHFWWLSLGAGATVPIASTWGRNTWPWG